MQYAELVAYILAPFLASGALYHLGKLVLDSIWLSFLNFLGNSGLFGEREVQEAMYAMVASSKGFPID